LLDGRKDRCRRKRLGGVASQGYSETILGSHREVDFIAGIADVELGEVMLAGKEASANHVIDPRTRIAPPNEHPFSQFAALVPFDCDPMRGVFTRDAHPRRHRFGPHLLKSDETDPRESPPVDQFRTKSFRQLSGGDSWVDPKVDQNAPADDARYRSDDAHNVLLYSYEHVHYTQSWI
jgi:hypothetical protein